MTTTYAGIDYGLGKTNIDRETGIRYGVIPFNVVCQVWCDESEGFYPEIEEEEECGFDCCIEPLGHKYNNEGYKAIQSNDNCDIFIEKSPYFTYAQFCSPCAPGACYLPNHLEGPSDNNKCYCFGHDWFDDGKAPYPVYSVETGKLVSPE